MANPHLAATLSIRVSPEIRDQLEALSNATGRTKSFLAAEAIQEYLAMQAWQVNGINSAIKKADSRDADFVEHSQVTDWLNTWGTKNEKGSPE